MYYINPQIENLYRVKFHDHRGGVLRLDMNENPEGLPEDFVESVKGKLTPEFLATYPEKDTLAGLLAQHNQVEVQNISITSGSDEAMRLIFQCFGEPGKTLVTVTPTFEMYDVYSKMFGMDHRTAEYNRDFTLSLDRVLSCIDSDTGLVVLLNPNSPIGACWTEQEARTVIEKASEVGAVVVVDEAYHYFYSSTFLPMALEYENLIVLRTFSKLFSCAGLRIGYAVGHEKLIHVIENAASTFNVNSVAILFAEELMGRPDLCQELIAVERDGRQWLTEQLKGKGYQTISGAGNYVLLKPNRSSQEIVSELKEQGVWVRDYSRGILSGWVRVSTGSRRCMERFWNAFLQVDGEAL